MFVLAIGAIALVWALFNLHAAGFGASTNMLQGALSLLFAFPLLFHRYPLRRGVRWAAIVDRTLAALALASAAYVVINADRFLTTYTIKWGWDAFFAIVMVVVILEGARRSIGPVLPMLAVLSLLYAAYGYLVPGEWQHAGFSWLAILRQVYIAQAGLWGSIVGVTIVVVPIFVIMGTLILASGAGNAFAAIGARVAGRADGGAAKVSVIASSLFAMLSGSAVANVATTGTITIPLMKRLGYRPEFAGAVEAVASMGGQIMPPVMGAAAFIMAELLSKPYVEIAKASFFPAVLLYLCIYVSIHAESKRLGLKRMPPEMLSAMKLVELLTFIVPVVVLLAMLFTGYSARFSAFGAVVATALTFLATGGQLQWQALLSRIKAIGVGLVESSNQMMPLLFISCCAQILVSMLGYTGLGVKVTGLILSLGGDNVLLALVLSAAVVLLLGMGVPTTAAYVLAASVIAPTLTAFTGMKILPISAHMFVFYFAVIANITPPVCNNVFVAAGIAGSKWLPTAVVAVKLGVVAFIIPFLFIYTPQVMMLGDWGEIVFVSATATLAVFALASALAGFLFTHLRVMERLGLLIAGTMLFTAGGWQNGLGLLAGAIPALLAYRRYRREGAHAPEHAVATS